MSHGAAIEEVDFADEMDVEMMLWLLQSSPVAGMKIIVLSNVGNGIEEQQKSCPQCQWNERDHMVECKKSRSKKFPRA
ncbi:hypothetical protein L1887_41940 [Cichorium endivia]|nr:hypothetical protein L1887_41940 [Cichorium endivia]